MMVLLALEQENFDEQRRALREPGLPLPGRLGSTVVPPRALLDAAGGGLLLVDWARGEVCARLDLPMPSGLAWPDPEGPLWVACQRPNEVWAVEPGNGQVLHRWRHAAFNDLHRMTPRPGGGALVVSSGTDSVIALDTEGREAWSWWGDPRVDRRRWHADLAIPTLARELHPISIAALGPDRALITSFHHGNILEIAGDGTSVERFAGLQQPHGLVRTPDGWLVADTGRGRILRLDPALQAATVLREGGRWLQDLAPTPSGGVLVVENKDFRGSAVRSGGPRLIELSATGRELARLELAPEWRLAALLLLDPPRCERLRWPQARVRGRYRRASPAETAPD